MISDHHRGLLNGAREPLEWYPPLIHRWCTHHFSTNIWKKQLSKEVIIRLKVLCKVKKEKKFQARLKELEKMVGRLPQFPCLSPLGMRSIEHVLSRRRDR
jgi:hypothetical protein